MVDIQKLIADSIQEELALGGDAKSAASCVMGALTDEGFAIVAEPRR